MKCSSSVKMKFLEFAKLNLSSESLTDQLFSRSHSGFGHSITAHALLNKFNVNGALSEWWGASCMRLLGVTDSSFCSPVQNFCGIRNRGVDSESEIFLRVRLTMYQYHYLLVAGIVVHHLNQCGR